MAKLNEFTVKIKLDDEILDMFKLMEKRIDFLENKFLFLDDMTAPRKQNRLDDNFDALRYSQNYYKPKLEVGDKVKYIGDLKKYTYLDGLTGTVYEISDNHNVYIDFGEEPKYKLVAVYGDYGETFFRDFKIVSWLNKD